MLAYRYQVWSWGNQRSDCNEKRLLYDVGIVGIAKRDSENPYEVFNELVCMNLGRAIGLPIPIGLVLEKDGDPYYVSAIFGAAVGEFPPADVIQLVQKHPKLSCGTVIFDVWVGNVDRHARNIYFDEEDGKVFLFDHGAAILGRSGSQHLTRLKDRFEICNTLRDEISNFDDFRFWFERILTLPEYLIRETFEEASKVGVDSNVVDQACDLLLQRRRTLDILFDQHSSSFRKYQAQVVNPFV